MFHGSDRLSMTLRTPAVNRSASEIMTVKASSVSTCSRVARMAATDSALPASVPPTPPVSIDVGALVGQDPVGQGCGQPERPARNAAADGLPDSHEVGVEPPGAGAAAGSRAEGMRLVVDQQRAVDPGQLPDRGEVAGLGQHDADVGQRRFHQHGGDVAVGQFPLERGHVVELHDPGRRRRIDRRAGIAWPARGPSGPAMMNVSSTLPW